MQAFKPEFKPGREMTIHIDGTVSHWDVYLQQWRRVSADAISNRVLASLPGADREAIQRAAGKSVVS